MAYGDWDDNLIHQVPSSLDHVQDSDRHRTETDQALPICGYGVIPNQQSGSGYANSGWRMAATGNVAASRQVVDDRWNAGAGPMNFTVLEPRNRRRLQLGPDPSGLEYNVEYRARAPLCALKTVFGRKNGKFMVNQQRNQQSAYYSGWVRFDNQSMSVHGFYGSRDRTWGIRNHTTIDMWIWFVAPFDDRPIAPWVAEVIFVDEDARCLPVPSILASTSIMAGCWSHRATPSRPALGRER